MKYRTPLKLTLEQARDIKRRARIGVKYDSLAVEYNISKSLVCRIAKGERWKQLNVEGAMQ